MSKIPSLKPREVLDILFAAGFQKIRTSGSHIRLIKGIYRVTIPFHSRSTIPTGTLMSIIKQAGMKKDEFFSYCKKKR